jgi:hypothetical protein
LDVVEWLVIHRRGGCVGPITGLDDFRREKNNQIELKVVMPALNLAARYEVRWGNGVMAPCILILSADGREWRDYAPFVLTRRKFHQ